ncbi:UNVERIFIED_CONTAM: hypothetical protein N8J90_00890 [Halobacillus marinus]|uniref:hypothetical protein n=1 Tax=Bacillaceae TaxID=186817 RepID=UPI0002A50209|nr:MULTISPECIES: hypothetical protein [Bacillaceae]ELK44341.1 hypothetical protein D479_19443 [Halobacillus sp. BAB-2008]QHT46321.1 hypothetical protein M662_07370 [Bacillus sp. SB49]
MFSNRKTKKGKWLAYLGTWIFAVGLAFSEIFDLDGMPKLLEAASIPMLVTGLLMIITSNFFNKKRSIKTLR